MKRQVTTRLRFPAVQNFSFLHSIHADSLAHSASTEYVPGASSPEIKRPGREADHSLLLSAEVKNGGAILPLPHMSLWHSEKNCHELNLLLSIRS
jgi:hypothetical protein